MKNILLVFFCLILGVVGCRPVTESAIAYSSDCWVDGIDGKADAVVSTMIGTNTFTGWAGDGSTGKSPGKVSIQILNAKGAVVKIGSTESMLPRVDVANASGKPGYRDSGFSVSLDSTGLEKGDYSISIVMSTGESKTLCPVSKKIIFG